MIQTRIWIRWSIPMRNPIFSIAHLDWGKILISINLTIVIPLLIFTQNIESIRWLSYHRQDVLYLCLIYRNKKLKSQDITLLHTVRTMLASTWGHLVRKCKIKILSNSHKLPSLWKRWKITLLLKIILTLSYMQNYNNLTKWGLQ